MLQVFSRPAAGEPKQGRKVLSTVPSVLMHQVLETVCTGAPRMYLMRWFQHRNQDPSTDATSAWILGRWSINSPFQVFPVWILPTWQKCSEGAGLIGISSLRSVFLGKKMHDAGFTKPGHWSIQRETGNTKRNGVLSWRFLITGKYRSQPWAHRSFILSLPSIWMFITLKGAKVWCFVLFFFYLPVQPTRLEGL